MKNNIKVFMIDVFILSSILVYLGSLATGDHHGAGSTITVGPYFQYLNKSLKSANGRDLGRIEQIAFGSDGRAKYAVISYENKLVAVPWDAGDFRTEGDHVVANLSKGKLDKEPNLSGRQF